jgi:hypothetical protein
VISIASVSGLNLTALTAFTSRFAKLIPAQIRRLIFHIRNNEGYVDEFMRELNLAKRPDKHFM